MRSVGASERVFELLQRKPLVRFQGGTVPSLQLKVKHVYHHNITHRDSKGELQLEHVSFAYPSRPTVTVLNDLNLTLYPNTVTALVGTSGGGKSTIAHLIECFYYPTK